MALGWGLRHLAVEIGLDPLGELWQTAVVPFVAGAFSLGRAVAYRSLARAVNGELDPPSEGIPDKPVLVEVDPDGTTRWYYEGAVHGR